MNYEGLKQELALLLEEKHKRLNFNRSTQLFADTGKYKRALYPKHMQFIKATKEYTELAFIAANRIGKTMLAGYMLKTWLTGEYPEWWNGRVFDRPVHAWAVGITNEETKSVLQRVLFGEIGQEGTGLIPKDKIDSYSSRPGVPNAIGHAQIKHASGGLSTIEFKSYVQGWETFQGTKKDIIWLDEEPGDYKIYAECFTRTAGDTGDEGLLMCTFTPLLGYSEIVLSFLPGGKFPENGTHPENVNKYVICAGWDDVPHLSAKWKENALKAFPPHLREAKSKGIPSQGSGAIYPIAEEDILVDPLKEIPPYWPRAFGMDFGWTAPTAVIWAAQDPDSKIYYLYSEHYLKQQIPAVHAYAIKQRGKDIPGVCDPAGAGSAGSSGLTWIEEYQDLEIDIIPAKGGPKTKEPRISKVLSLLQTGQLKVFRGRCPNWLEEYRIYQRDENGKIKDGHDDLMNATEYLFSMIEDIKQPLVSNETNYNYLSQINDRDPITGY